MHVNMSSDCYNERDDSTRYNKKKQIEPNQSTGQEKTTVDWTRFVNRLTITSRFKQIDLKPAIFLISFNIKL